MSTVPRADWAALAPWNGIQGKPAYLLANGIPVAAIIGLEDLFPDTPVGVVRWEDIIGKPSFGSAAYSPVSDFATAEQGALADSAIQPGDNVSELVNDAGYITGLQGIYFQSGEEPLVMAQQAYEVIFPLVMVDVPDIQLQVYMTDGSSELFYTAVREDLTDANGFTFKLNSPPLANSGKVKWEARVPL